MAADDEEGVAEPGVTEPARIGARLGSSDPRSIASQPQPPREALRIVKGAWYGGHPAAVSSIAFSPDGGRFVVGDAAGWLIIRSRSGEITARTQVPPIGPYSKPYVLAVAWSPDNQYIATQDLGVVRLRNPTDLATVAEQDRTGVGLLGFGGGGRWLVTLGLYEATIRSVPALSDLATLTIEPGHWDVFDIDHLAVDPEGSFIATGDSGGWDEDALGNSAGYGTPKVTLIDGEKQSVTGAIEEGNQIHDVGFDRWRRRLLVLTSKGIGVWSLSGKSISRFAPYEGRTGVYDRIAGTVAISEHWIVTLPHFEARRQTMDFWDPSTFKPLASIELPKKGRPGRIAASPDGKMLVASEAGDGDFGVRFWSVE